MLPLYVFCRSVNEGIECGCKRFGGGISLEHVGANMHPLQIFQGTLATLRACDYVIE
jgi:hypothetical protein